MEKNIVNVSIPPADSSSTEKPSDLDQSYLIGLRGLLTIESFLWTFLSVFAPSSVVDSDNDDSGPRSELILRQTLSVLLWNKSLIYSALILLSARTICIPFLQRPSARTLASAVFRRGVRLWLPIATSLAIVKILSSTLGTAHIATFRARTGNVSIATPYSLPSALAYFNSVFNLFWATARFQEQAGNTAFPAQTLWVVSMIYAQSYTVFMTMVIVPYTRAAWRVKAYLCFIFTAWWVQSWASYSVVGLLLADMVLNMGYREKAERGLKVWRTSKRCPVWVPCGLLMAAGLVWQFLMASKHQSEERKSRTGLFYPGGIDVRSDVVEPRPKTADYLLLVGFFFLLECSRVLQRIFKNNLFLYLGKRSLSKWQLQFSPFYISW